MAISAGAGRTHKPAVCTQSRMSRPGSVAMSSLRRIDLVPGLRDSALAMPLEDFVSDVVDIPENQPAAEEI